MEGKAGMSDPVVLIGTSWDDGTILVVGLYATAEDAGFAVQHGDLPSANYSVMTPALGAYVQLRNLQRSNSFPPNPQY